ncbi:GNAT family N-acetyltransferase [Thalassotalea piscium]|uniref:CelD/BcsL family acetyltransferase involved in cellulose biosynthesis n=1 Tax=Thalassotalea piscium TaxID=1230533 RepID=A0A7X0NEG4_9GAMM|nr:GNAT family N-acetyltransferase [Thalassotalea piscium]MBB6541932.1 CelD/BcsL family acetyltransferase involved in cellulose biosynthesis [Thalassotalea piscium]
MSLELSVITSLEEFELLATKWESFRRQHNDNNICNGWDWLNTWLDIFGSEKDQLYLHVWRYQQEIVGIIPCYLKTTLAGKELRFIATGEPIKSEVCSEFQDFIINAEFEERILKQFSDQVTVDQNFSAIIFDNIIETSIANRWLNTLSISNWVKKINSVGTRYIIPVQKKQEAQLSGFKSKSIKRHAKNFISNTDYQVIAINEKKALAGFYQQLIIEHNTSWQKRGETGAFENKSFVAFHRTFSERMLEKNKLVVFKIANKTEIAALFYGFIDGNTLYYYQSAVNHDSKLSSAGVAMHVVALNIAREKKLKFYDLMKGSNDSYKTRYITSDITVINASTYTLKYKFIKNIIKLFQKFNIRISKLISTHN